MPWFVLDIVLKFSATGGGVVFDVLATLDFKAAQRSNCSLCRRHAAVMVSCHLDQLNILQGDDLLTFYQWSTHTARHYFCKTCDVYTFHQRRTDPSVYGVNIGCFDDVDGTAFHDMYSPQMGCRSRLCLNNRSAFHDPWFSHVIIMLTICR